MYVINNFSNQKYSKLSDLDKLVWLISVMHYKSLGYTTKLYCFPEDIEFLKNTPIHQYYDEIDTATFLEDQSLKTVNTEKFWFWRKIVAIENEFKLGNDFFYSDTDVVLTKKLDLTDCDLLVWWKEDQDKKNWKKTASVYVDWNTLSMPKNYKMPKYIRKTKRDNYNAGLLWFKEKSTFDLWKKDMLDFMTANPCKFIKTPEYCINAVWACNTEQRILKGVADHLKLNVKAFDENIYSRGVTSGGAHLFYWRSKWRFLKANFNRSSYYGNLWSITANKDLAEQVLILCDFVRIWMNELKQNGYFIEWVYFMNTKYINELLILDDRLKYLLMNYEEEELAEEDKNDEELLLEYERNLAKLNNC